MILAIHVTKSLRKKVLSFPKRKKKRQMNSKQPEMSLLRVSKAQLYPHTLFGTQSNLHFTLLTAKKFREAAEQYTEAIFCKISAEKKAVLYCNRSFASLKMEENQLALFDACEAIKLDPANVKGFYRQGQAYVSLR